MSGPKNASSAAGSIAAAGSVEIELDVSLSRSVAIVVKNTGASEIDSASVAKSLDDVTWVTDTTLTTALGTPDAGAAVLLELKDLAVKTVRITLGSTAGTDYAVQMRGY